MAIACSIFQYLAEGEGESKGNGEGHVSRDEIGVVVVLVPAAESADPSSAAAGAHQVMPRDERLEEETVEVAREDELHQLVLSRALLPRRPRTRDVRVERAVRKALHQLPLARALSRHVGPLAEGARRADHPPAARDARHALEHLAPLIQPLHPAREGTREREILQTAERLRRGRGASSSVGEESRVAAVGTSMRIIVGRRLLGPREPSEW